MTASKRTLSSRLTIYYKFLFPAVWIVVGGIGMVALWTFAVQGADGKEVPIEAKCIGLGIWSAGTVMGLIRDIPSCKELVERIIAEAEGLIRGRLGRAVSSE